MHICYRLRRQSVTIVVVRIEDFLTSNSFLISSILKQYPGHSISCHVAPELPFSIASFNHFISGLVDFTISTPCNFVPSLAKWSACWSPSRSLCSVTQQFLFWIHDSALPPLITAFDLIALESSISNATCHSRCKL